MVEPSLTVIGVRHHSPACARLVEWTIERVRPEFVLIEGPADMNARLDELRLPHTLPLAVFTYRTSAFGSQSSWTPFCAHSPEWVALRAADRVGAQVRFIDLPAWHKAFWGVRNRYADRRRDRATRLVDRLCERFATSDTDALWEHLFEQPLAEEQLGLRLREYFAELRAEEPADERDAPREEYMGRFIAAALAEAHGAVVVVCGGYHASALAAVARGPGGAAEWPRLPVSPDGCRTGSYLVPYSFHRLDSFTGYESGMPSPAYQDASYREGSARAADLLLERTVQRLRGKRVQISAADVIAAAAMAEGLRRVRGHAVVSRIDLLDALGAALVKDALDVALPWTYRGTLLPRTDPLLVEVMATFSGDRVGKLAEGTPRPPLVDDVQAQLHAHDLVPERVARSVELHLTSVADVERSRVLHRLRVLAVPGFTRRSGPAWATEGTLTEVWALSAPLEAEAALLEASAHGATLEAAAAARLEEAFVDRPGNLDVLASLLADAVFIGIQTLADRVLTRIAERVGSEPMLDVVGRALGHLLGLWRHDTLLGSAGSRTLGAVIEAAFERGLWLVEGVQGGEEPADVALLSAVLALRDTARHGGGRLSIGRDHAVAIMRRRMNDAEAPPALRGAALGYLWSAGGCASADEAQSLAIGAVRRAARPASIGDFLVGLFVLAREEVLGKEGLLAAIDSVVGELPRADFLVALPALRLAFSYFPPADKETLAAQVLVLHGADTAGARLVTRLVTPADVVAAGMALEVEVARLADLWGLNEVGEDR